MNDEIPDMITSEEIKDCFPEGAIIDNATGKIIVSAQWLHDFAIAIAYMVDSKYTEEKDYAH